MRSAVALALTVSFLSIPTLQAQNRPALEAGELPRVVVLATGGTIATRFDPAVGVDLGLLTGEQIVAAAPGLAEVASVDVEQISNVGSRNMTPEIWRRLGSRVNELLSSPDVTGIVVTHGTDTLEETAFFLDLTVTSDKPVVLVGAQRAPTYFDTDGPRNLLDAVRVAVSEESVGMGTLVVLNGEINAAREVTKVHTLARETFRALEFGALDGIVIAGLGLGHVTSKTLAAIREARGRGIPVVLSHTSVHRPHRSAVRHQQ